MTDSERKPANPIVGKTIKSIRHILHGDYFDLELKFTDGSMADFNFQMSTKMKAQFWTDGDDETGAFFKVKP